MALSQSSRTHSIRQLEAAAQGSQARVCHVPVTSINHAPVMHRSNLWRKWDLCIFFTGQEVEYNHSVLQAGVWETPVLQNPVSAAGFHVCPGVNHLGMSAQHRSDISALLRSGHRQKQGQIQGRHSHKNTN